MADLSKILLFRMTHIDNISHILQYGITHVNSPNANTNYVAIGDISLISNRSSFTMPNGNTLGEYIPFYFGYCMPMLYVIQKGFNGVKTTPPENIVYCITSVEQVVAHKLEFVFTDGHAVDALSSFYNSTEVNDIETFIDKDAINKKYWRADNDLDLKRRKEAEFLIKNDVPKNAILGFVVYNISAQKILTNLGITEQKAVIKNTYYF